MEKQKHIGYRLAKWSFSLIISILITSIFAGCSSPPIQESIDTQDTNPAYTSVDMKEIEKYLECSFSRCSAMSNIGVVFVKNNNDIVVNNLDINIVYYDSTGNIIKAESSRFDNILPEHEYAMLLRIGNEEFDHVELSINSVSPGFNSGGYNLEYKDGMTLDDYVNIDANNNKTTVNVKYTNVNEQDINFLQTTCVYYKKGEIIGADYDAFEIDKEKSVVKSFNETSTPCLFDEYKVYVSQIF